MHMVEDADLEIAEREWLDGGSALSLIELHVDRGDRMQAMIVARMALEQGDCADSARIEGLLYSLDEAPGGWDQLLADFAQQPSVERWRDLLRFVPPEQIYHRVRNAIRRLRASGVDSNILFLCACELGMTPDAIQLVEEGCVRAATIEERAAIAGGAQATYYGLAATAAFLDGDIIAMVRLLRQSAAHQNEWFSPLPHIVFIRERATAEVQEMLDRAGIPSIDELLGKTGK